MATPNIMAQSTDSSQNAVQRCADTRHYLQL